MALQKKKADIYNLQTVEQSVLEADKLFKPSLLLTITAALTQTDGMRAKSRAL
jgi:hypothetical protein